MKHTILSVAALAGAALGAQVASADSGTITFTGNILSNTCTVNAGTGSTFTVSLPDVSLSSFTTTPNAGRTGFNLRLTDCKPADGNVHAFFNTGVRTNFATGNLRIESGPEFASGIELTLHNASDGSQIMMGHPDATQHSLPVALVGGAGQLNYWVEYAHVGTTAVTAGHVLSSVIYDIHYQ